MRYYYVIRLVLFTAIAVLIGVQSPFLIDHLKYLVGCVMILFGIEGVLIPILNSPKKFYQDVQLYLGHVDLILGLVVLLAVPENEFDHVCIIWATWTIVRESFDLYEISHKAIHGFPAVFSFVLSITEIVFSVFLLLESNDVHHAMTHIYLLIPEFIINGVSPLLFDIHKTRRKKKSKKEDA